MNKYYIDPSNESPLYNHRNSLITNQEYIQYMYIDGLTE